MCGPTAITLSGPRSTGTLLSVLVSETAAAPSLLGVRVGGTLGVEVALFWRVLGASGEFGVGGVVGEEFHSLGKPRELDVVVRWLVGRRSPKGADEGRKSYCTVKTGDFGIVARHVYFLFVFFV